ncbi:serine/threonine-protein kinase [Coraliomargarita sp. SDUM461004]|uniref:Serine/threonine-protein kinase n=1 Tax=Thalassobacterium sedimentorum TaxID=3041258 RepID=A0ABU1ADN5_9BACT|nr:serine/threonine-protein kinase [Coraliomargarita sp. SDUM461004]MDQ8192827.1 serine/threonine-protein kinase [Coraliomargarita sp. SDUM461004]
MSHLKHIFNELHFKLVRVIAEGGMGIVYEAEQRGAGKFVKRVAVKLIREEYSKIKEFRDNFVGEARLVADLIHTNIVQTYHLGEISGQYFMTMEYVDGITLEDFLQRHRDTQQLIPCDLATFIVSRVCRGLSHAHQRCDKTGRNLGIVHRDVNPRNIMLAREGDVKLTDFGIAKAFDLMYNEEGEVIAGKDEYLSPEQARREVTDARADLFSCAILLSELLLTENIFETNREEATRKNILELSIPDFTELRPEVDPRLDDILQHGFKRDRNKRYQSAQAMLTALEMFLYGDGYGPTNEKLAAYMADLFGENGDSAAERWNEGTTPGLAEYESY